MSHRRWQLPPRRWPGRRRGLPRTGGSYTKPVRKTSTLHDATPEAGFARADMNTFCRLDELGLEVTGQRLAPGPCGSRVPGRRVRSVVPPLRLPRRRVTPCPGHWRTSHWAGGPRSFTSRSDATAASTAGTCGGKTQPRRLSRRRSSRAAGCGRRLKPSSASTSPSPVSPKGSGSPGTPPTTLSWPRASVSSSTTSVGSTTSPRSASTSTSGATPDVATSTSP